MRVDILTLFPEMFKGPFDESIIKRAQDKGLVEIKIHNLRNWATDKRSTVDDRPYGGGPGMILRVDVLYGAIMGLMGKAAFEVATTKKKVWPKSKNRIVLLDATGKKFTQAKAIEYSKLDYLLLIAGHYEGVDHRTHEHLFEEVISIGDYILTGGELPAMIITDAVVRLIPGVLEKPEATEFESFSGDLLEYPQYTRPEDFLGWKVPEILLSGDHKKIEEWRKQKAKERTKKQRPDLL